MNCPYGHPISHDNFTGCYKCAEEEARMVREKEEWDRDRPARIADGEECPHCGETNRLNIDYIAPPSKCAYYYCAYCGESWAHQRNNKAADQTDEPKPGEQPKEKV